MGKKCKKCGENIVYNIRGEYCSIFCSQEAEKYKIREVKKKRAEKRAEQLFYIKKRMEHKKSIKKDYCEVCKGNKNLRIKNLLDYRIYDFEKDNYITICQNCLYKWQRNILEIYDFLAVKPALLEKLYNLTFKKCKK